MRLLPAHARDAKERKEDKVRLFISYRWVGFCWVWGRTEGCEVCRVDPFAQSVCPGKLHQRDQIKKRDGGGGDVGPNGAGAGSGEVFEAVEVISTLRIDTFGGFWSAG